MQVSGSYSAIGALTAIDPAQQARSQPRRSGSRAGDTVSISDEARAAYRNACRRDGEDTFPGEADTGATFRQALEEAWSDTGNGGTSLFARIRSALGA